MSSTDVEHLGHHDVVDSGLHDLHDPTLAYQGLPGGANPYGIAHIPPEMSYAAYAMGDLPLPASAYPLPDPTLLNQPRKTERRRPPGKKNSDVPHIPRPRNAFILFRSAFIEQKNGKELASKQQNLSRIAAMVWKSMNAAEQDPWYKLAAEEKQAHYAANPGYTFQPSGRGEGKRKTRKPAMEPQLEENSCKRIADLIISGVQGEDLVAAAKHEGVAPFQRLERRQRRNPGVPSPLMTEPISVAVNPVGVSMSHSPGGDSDSSDSDQDGVAHYPPASPNPYGDYARAPSPKF